MALSLSLVYIPIHRLPDVPKFAIFSSKLTWSVYPGMDILAKSIGCLWALGLPLLLLSNMAIKRSARLFVSLFVSWL